MADSTPTFPGWSLKWEELVAERDRYKEERDLGRAVIDGDAGIIADLRAERDGLREQVANLQRHNDKLHRRLEEHLPSDYGAVKGELRKAWEKAKAWQRSNDALRTTIENLEGKIERQSARIDSSEAERNRYKAALWDIVRLPDTIGSMNRADYPEELLMARMIARGGLSGAWNGSSTP
jgi:chromosome segregation ATPase